jgi:hypothetical protein
MQPAAAPVVVQLVSHGFVVTLTQESDIQKRIEQIKSATHRDILQVNVIGTILRFDAQSHSGFN